MKAWLGRLSTSIELWLFRAAPYLLGTAVLAVALYAVLAVLFPSSFWPEGMASNLFAEALGAIGTAVLTVLFVSRKRESDLKPVRLAFFTSLFAKLKHLDDDYIHLFAMFGTGKFTLDAVMSRILMKDGIEHINRELDRMARLESGPVTPLKVDFLADPEVHAALTKVAALLRGFDGLIKDLESIHRLTDTFTPFMPPETIISISKFNQGIESRLGQFRLLQSYCLGGAEKYNKVRVESFTFDMLAIVLEIADAARNMGFVEIANEFDAMKKFSVDVKQQQKTIKQLADLFDALYYSEEPKAA
jgi:hypothetical protein